MNIFYKIYNTLLHEATEYHKLGLNNYKIFLGMVDKDGHIMDQSRWTDNLRKETHYSGAQYYFRYIPEVSTIFWWDKHTVPEDIQNNVIEWLRHKGHKVTYTKGLGNSNVPENKRTNIQNYYKAFSHGYPVHPGD